MRLFTPAHSELEARLRGDRRLMPGSSDQPALSGPAPSGGQYDGPSLPPAREGTTPLRNAATGAQSRLIWLAAPSAGITVRAVPNQAFWRVGIPGDQPHPDPALLGYAAMSDVATGIRRRRRARGSGRPRRAIRAPRWVPAPIRAARRACLSRRRFMNSMKMCPR